MQRTRTFRITEQKEINTITREQSNEIMCNKTFSIIFNGNTSRFKFSIALLENSLPLKFIPFLVLVRKGNIDDPM